MKYTEPKISYQLFGENIVTESPSSVKQVQAQIEAAVNGAAVRSETVNANTISASWD